LLHKFLKTRGGLPVLVELLAGTNPKPGLPLPDISKDAVKRFLQWIPEDEKRWVALLASVPRKFNLDILSAALGENAKNDFRWLSVQSYIRTDTERGWFYHEKVRELMLRYLRNTNPGDLIAIHKRLADFFESEQDKMNLEGKAAYSNKTWRNFEEEKVYHQVCNQVSGNVNNGINAFLQAFRWRWRYAEIVLQAIQQAANEINSEEMLIIVNQLSKFYQNYDKDENEKFIKQATFLTQRDDLSIIAEVALYSRRGTVLRLTGNCEKAVEDLTYAIKLDSKYTWALFSRGKAYLKMKEYEKAIDDFNSAIEFDSEYKWAFDSRGETYRELGEYEKAIDDFNRVIDLDSEFKWAFDSRGETYREMGEYEKAIDDFNSVIDLDSEYKWAFASRGDLYWEIGNLEQALTDFNNAIELDNQFHDAQSRKGIILRSLNQLEEAIEAFSHSENSDSICSSCLSHRGEIYRRMGKYEEALSNLKLAIEKDPSDQSYERSRRAAVYHVLGELDARDEDILHVMNLPSEQAHILYNKAIVCMLINEHQKALILLKEAIEKNALARTYARYDDLFQPIKNLIEFQDLIKPPITISNL